MPTRTPAKITQKQQLPLKERVMEECYDILINQLHADIEELSRDMLHRRASTSHYERSHIPATEACIEAKIHAVNAIRALKMAL